jgi:hypothetical protein
MNSIILVTYYPKEADSPKTNLPSKIFFIEKGATSLPWNLSKGLYRDTLDCIRRIRQRLSRRLHRSSFGRACETTHEFGEQRIREAPGLQDGVEALCDFFDPADLHEDPSRKFILNDDRGDQS